MFNSCPGYLDSSGVWNNGFSCQPINNRIRVCCGPENRRECCFADQLPHRSDLSIDSDLFSSSSSLVNKNESNITISPSSYILILIAIGLTLILLLVLLIAFIYIIRRKLKRSSSSSSSSSSCSSDSTSINKHCRRLSIAVGSSSKSSASSPVPSTYVDYWSRTIISPSEWTLAKPYNSFLGGGHHTSSHNYYINQ